MKNLRLATLNATPAPFDPAKGEAGLPQRFRVLPWGNNDTVKGPVIVNSTTLSSLPGFQKRHNWDKRIVLDFEHATVPGTPGYSPLAEVAGYGPVDVVDGDGIYMTMSSWTADGKRLAGGGHFADVSATVVLNEANEVVGVHSVALCRNGAVPGAVFLSAWPLTAPRDVQPPQTAEELFGALKSALGAAHDATPMQVAQALQSKIMANENKDDKNKKDGEPETAPTVPPVTIETLSSNIKDLTKLVEGQAATITALSSQVKALGDSGDKRERELVLSTAASEGKEVPAAAKDLPLDTLRTLCSQLPVTIPMERRTPVTTTLSSGAPVNDSVAKLTGVSKEDREKYGAM